MLKLKSLIKQDFRLYFVIKMVSIKKQGILILELDRFLKTKSLYINIT